MESAAAFGFTSRWLVQRTLRLHRKRFHLTEYIFKIVAMTCVYVHGRFCCTMILYEISLFELEYWTFLGYVILFVVVWNIVFRILNLENLFYISRSESKLIKAGSLFVVFGMMIFMLNGLVPYTIALDESRLSIVEGQVNILSHGGRSSQERERIRINGVEFEFSERLIRPGYRKYAKNDGLLTEGRLVRISYIGNTIVKIEG